jgi:hypothetical protein
VGEDDAEAEGSVGGVILEEAHIVGGVTALPKPEK